LQPLPIGCRVCLDCSPPKRAAKISPAPKPSLLASGEADRVWVDVAHKPIVFYGTWLFFGPLFLCVFAAFVAIIVFPIIEVMKHGTGHASLGDGLTIVVGILATGFISLITGLFLFRVTKRYVAAQTLRRELEKTRVRMPD
jgi:hypothetical protein